MLELGKGQLSMPDPTPDGQPNMESMPVIEMGWLADEADRVRLREALRLALRLAASEEMAAVLEGPIEPLPEVVTADSSDEDIDRWVRFFACQPSTTRHHCSQSLALLGAGGGACHHVAPSEQLLPDGRPDRPGRCV